MRWASHQRWKLPAPPPATGCARNSFQAARQSTVRPLFESEKRRLFRFCPPVGGPVNEW